MNMNDIRTSWAALKGATGLRPIQDKAGYEHMVALADALVESGLAQSELSDLFGLISSLIADYDDKHYAIPSGSPRDVLRFLMEQHGLTQSDLPELGSQGVMSEILSGRRMLNARQIAKLVARFGVSADLLLEPAETAP